jgi:hypothetical protein
VQGKVTGCGAENIDANYGRVNRATINNAWLNTKLGKETIFVGSDVHI